MLIVDGRLVMVPSSTDLLRTENREPENKNKKPSKPRWHEWQMATASNGPTVASALFCSPCLSFGNVVVVAPMRDGLDWLPHKGEGPLPPRR